ncbi:unnamed protein product [Calypogeia fissa]
MKEADVTKCQIQEWYPRFRRVTFRTLIHVLPKEFVDYLLEDGVFLSRSSEAMPTRTVVTCPELQSEGYEHWEEEDDEGTEPEVPSFPELEGDVKASIEKLGGSVFPKLNWSAPKDTSWISTTGNLKCKNFGEVLLLLKASDSVVHDLCHAFDGCEDKAREQPEEIVLALRKWYDLRPEREFRAFVFGKVLVGICQREVTGFYPALVGCVDEFEFAMADFFHEYIRDQFDAENYTFDCYVTKDGTVKLLDFNPWAGSTLPLLFSWEELEENYATTSAEIARVSAHMRARQAAIRVQEVEEGMEEMSVGSSTGPKLILAGRPLEDDNGRAENSSNGKSEAEKSTVDHVQYRVEMRIVMNEGLVQPGLRMGTGIPIDFVNKGNWEEVIKREAAQEAKKEQAGAAG